MRGDHLRGCGYYNEFCLDGVVECDDVVVEADFGDAVVCGCVTLLE